MKALLLITFLSISCTAVFGQYYYKDILQTETNSKKRALYELNKVKSVQFNSYDSYNQPIEGFTGSQKINRSFSEITTVTTTGLTGTTENTAYYNTAGQLVKTVDTSDGNRTVVDYTYDNSNRVSQIISRSFSPGGYVLKEQHNWQYDNDGKPQKMLKIKNDADTTYISFVADEQGNVGEEKTIHQGQAQPTVYYYYDAQNRLTDIVRFNIRANRLIPDYIFEYNSNNQPATMLVVTEGTGDYQKWYYKYNDRLLKTTDECFSKTKVLIGRIEYEYQYY